MNNYVPIVDTILISRDDLLKRMSPNTADYKYQVFDCKKPTGAQTPLVGPSRSIQEAMQKLNAKLASQAN